MKAAIIACEMSRAELTRLIESESARYPVFWIKPALHNDPRKLHDHLQRLMDEHEAEFDCYLLAMGQCGNATENLKTGDYSVVIPRVDDCITTLLGSFTRRMEISREMPTYFLTESWLGTDSGNLLSEYEYSLQKYGPRRGKVIYRQILKHYKRLGLLDTGCYDLNGLTEKVAAFAQDFSLCVEAIPTTDEYLRQLLLGPWPEDRFSVTPPHSLVHVCLY